MVQTNRGIIYEQNGKDRAEYGNVLLKRIANEFLTIKGLDERALQRFRLLYRYYPQIGSYLLSIQNSGSPPPFFELEKISGSVTPILTKFSKINFSENQRIGGKQILSKLSYTHLEQLVRIDDDLKRTFYEMECIKGTWSVRELKRQISSLYFERSGLSAKPEKLSELEQEKSTSQSPIDIIKNIYAFEFLDLKVKDAVEESDLETVLLDHLQEFIIELGNGFCFEARQKRILIGENHYFIDLVFYHRVLKCHVLMELKIGTFQHSDIGQLNTYLNYFREEISEKADKAPVGILLVADKDHALVKFATARMDKNLFVKQYLVKLPEKKELERYIDKELKKMKI